jgi:starch-binding outer membrane protein, SusD/RagB family
MDTTFRNLKGYLLVTALMFVAVNNMSCKKFLDVKAPSTLLNEDNVYASDETAIAVLTQIYATLVSEADVSGQTGISVLSGLSADELTLASVVTNEQLIAHYRNLLRTGRNANYGTSFWRSSMTRVFWCNAAIEGLTKSSSLTPGVKSQLLGEAKFIRSLLYFYLVNYYGDVPLVLTTNPNVTRLLPRSPKEHVYDQIVADLKDAESLLSGSFPNVTLLKPTSERVRPTKWAAAALLARTYLYLGEYADSESEASAIIANNAQFSLCDSIKNVFLKNSTEAIWQMQPVESGRNTKDAFTFMLPSTGPNRDNNPVYLSGQFLNAFESGDHRRQSGGWVDSVISGGITFYFPAKYRANITTGSATEYLMMFRLAEQYLIRAEARAQQSNIEGAKADLNEIRTRAGLPNTVANDQAALLTAILNERQVELFTEMGQRWFDLKRTGTIDAVMTQVTPLKANGANWQSYQQLFPVPYDDILRNPNLTQNPGY